MRERFIHPNSSVNYRQLLSGIAALITGLLIYLIARPSDQTYFVYNSPISISLHGIIPIRFGPIGNSLPSFIHVFAFILMTAGLMARKKRNYFIICLSWFVIDCMFEIGQKFKSWSITIIPSWFAGIPFLENARSFFLFGTYDAFDLAATTLGAIGAYFILVTTMGGGYCEKKP